jgi:hypothetical protein
LHLTSKYDPRTKGRSTSAAKGRSTTASKRPARKPAPAPRPGIPVEPPSAIPLSATHDDLDDLLGEVAAAPRIEIGTDLGDAGTPLAAPTPAAPTPAAPAAAATMSALDCADLGIGLDTKPSPAVADSSAFNSHSAGPAVAEQTIEVSLETIATDDDQAVRLTDEITDAELFCDPNLDVVRLTAGEEQVILVPVEVAAGKAMGADAAVDPKRYKLRLTLKLDSAS